MHTYRTIILRRDKGGRPPITETRKETMVSKLAPYLKSGLSIRKALSEAKIPRATFYRIMENDEYFRERINTLKQFTPVLLNNALVKELFEIIKKQSVNEPLTKEDIKFLWWFALKSKSTKEEWGRREGYNPYDSENEIQKLKYSLKNRQQPETGL